MRRLRFKVLGGKCIPTKVHETCFSVYPREETAYLSLFYLALPVNVEVMVQAQLYYYAA